MGLQVSKYFIGRHNDAPDTSAAVSGKVRNDQDQSVCVKGRRESTGNSGARFKDIEEPSSLEGKFIYKMEPSGAKGDSESVIPLKDISNSPEQDLEKVKRRNPFALNLKMKETTDLPVCTPPKEISLPQSDVEIIPSSQLSMYSIDNDSISFSSQGNEEVKVIVKDSSEIQSPPKDVSVKNDTVSPPNSVPRLGLSKFSYSAPKLGTPVSKTSSSSQKKLGPARVSGLSKSSMKKTNSEGGLRQASVLQMFARKCPKAQLGDST